MSELHDNLRWVERFLNNKEKEKRKQMSNFITGLIRTYVPIIVGALVAWLATIGLQLDAESQTGLIVALTGLLQALYYLIVRWLETKFPKAGILLGKATVPEYKK